MLTSLCQWISRLTTHKNCFPPLHRLIALCEESLLSINPESRISASALTHKLHSLLSDFTISSIYRDQILSEAYLVSPDFTTLATTQNHSQPRINATNLSRTLSSEDSASYAITTTSATCGVTADIRNHRSISFTMQKSSDDLGQRRSMSCPFRKRNPIRFNVRDYRSCALTSYPDYPQLKYVSTYYLMQHAASLYTYFFPFHLIVLNRSTRKAN